MDSNHVSELIRKCYSTFLARDRKTFEALLSDDFTFSSPHDPLLNKAGFFEKCWPNGELFAAFRIEKLFSDGDEAFVRYEIELKSGEKFKNVEFLKIAGHLLKAVEVYYGSLPD